MGKERYPMTKKILVILLCLAISLGFCACAGNGAGNSASGTPTTTPTAAPAETSAPVVIENMGITTSYEKAPERAVALSYSIAEIMVALGLKDKIVADAPSMYLISQVSDKYREEVASIPVLEGSYGVPSLETVLETNPDFVFGDSYSFFATNVGTAEDFHKVGVDIYATEGTCVDNASFENNYNDILNIGRIFRVEDRANALVSELREREKAVRSKVSGLEPVTIFFVDSDEEGGSISTIGNTGYLLYLLEMAGCKNIFDDTDGEFIAVSREEVIARNPDYILVCDYYGEGYAEQKIQDFKKSADMSDMDAVINDRFLVISGLAAFPSLESLDFVEEIAAAVHP